MTEGLARVRFGPPGCSGTVAIRPKTLGNIFQLPVRCARLKLRQYASESVIGRKATIYERADDEQRHRE